MEYTRSTLIKRLGEYVGILPSELHEIACEAVELLERFDCSKGNCGDLNSEWITDKMPDAEGNYLVTMDCNGEFVDWLYYGFPSMPNCKSKGMCWYHSDDEWGDVIYRNTDILAWMPLPKPYKGGDTE